ncbi:unnamed protein product [Mycetohabitans rhizoxinica HKI 454]|uniref:Uncharacterized protein n=1 Tax=Mycetohabitans rhizoxinica (strain DSM 19002 / CIP 109453 / HKI 454) TaxID=882378 RepID=E5ARR4_MYCRK|nr:unnamed protein product [Mycetohabitans rhizoxinica HKI 454]
MISRSVPQAPLLLGNLIKLAQLGCYLAHASGKPYIPQF